MHHPTPRSGSALVVVTMIIVILATAATLLTTQTVSQYQLQQGREASVQLLTSAESGFNQGYAWLVVNTDAIKFLPVVANTAPVNPGDLGWIGDRCLDPTITFPNTSLQVTVRKLAEGDVTKWGDETFLLTCIATSGHKTVDPDSYRREKVEALIVPFPTKIFKQAMFALQGYNVQGSAKTNSWTSSSTSIYQKSTPGANGDLTSDGQITVQKPLNVSGTVISNENMPLPVINTQAPAGTPLIAAVTGGLLSPGTYETQSLTINSINPLRIIGGTVTLYVDQSVSLDGDCLRFGSYTDRLIIYQNDYTAGISQLTGNDNIGSIIGQFLAGTHDRKPLPCLPQQFVLITNYSGTVKMAGNASFNGVIYAPNAAFDMRGTADVYGSIIAKRFDGQANTDLGMINASYFFHYDTTLGQMDFNLPPALQLTGWRTGMISFNTP